MVLPISKKANISLPICEVLLSRIEKQLKHKDENNFYLSYYTAKIITLFIFNQAFLTYSGYLMLAGGKTAILACPTPVRWKL